MPRVGLNASSHPCPCAWGFLSLCSMEPSPPSFCYSVWGVTRELRQEKHPQTNEQWPFSSPAPAGHPATLPGPLISSDNGLAQTKETQGHAWLRPNPQPACFINYTESSPALSLLRPPLCIHPLTAGAGDTGAARYGCWGEQDSTSPTRSRQLAVEMPGGKADPANTARASDLSTEG